MVQNSNGNMHSIDPSLVCIEDIKKFHHETNYAEKFDRDVHRDRSSAGY